jgi:hypothetical protein
MNKKQFCHQSSKTPKNYKKNPLACQQILSSWGIHKRIQANLAENIIHNFFCYNAAREKPTSFPKKERFNI